MTRLRIQHRTSYRYSAPVSFGPQRMVLRPREGPFLRIVRQEVRTEPAGKVTWRQDIHGNHVAWMEIPGAADSLTLLNDVTVEVGEPDSPLAGFTLPASCALTEEALTAAYHQVLWPSESETIREWMTQLSGFDGSESVPERVGWLVGAVHRHIRYQRRMEYGVQSPADTIRLGAGSCRDLATLTLEAVRTLGLPARFVSGYLHSSASEAGRGATHAWLEVYFPDGCWYGYDPTTGRAAGASHIPTGCSAHPRGVMPVSGTFDGNAGRSLGLDVSLTIREEPAHAH